MVLARRTAVATAAVALLVVPLGLPKFYLLLATEILIMGLFAMAFNLLLGYAGMVSFGLAGPRALYLFTVAIVVLVGGLLWRLVNAPFGRTLLAVRENAERAEFVGIHVRRVQLAAFVISGAVSGLAGALFSLFSRGAFPDYAYWTKSAEVLLMTLLGGPYVFLGPALGAAILIVLNSVVTSFTEYWPVVLGAVLLVLIYVFPGGVTRLFLVGPTAPARAPG